MIKIKRKRNLGNAASGCFSIRQIQTGSTCINFPRMKFRRQWISFVRQKREPDSWRPGSGDICSDHFMTEDYHGYGVKLADFTTKMLLKKDAILSKQVVPTPEQLATTRSKKRKLPASNERSESASPEQYTTPKIPRRALSKLTASRVCTLCTNIEMVLSPFECVTR